MLKVPIQNYINCLSLALGLSCGMRYLVTSDISPRISSKKKKAKSLRKLFFDILNSEDDYIYTPTLIKEVKLAKKCRKINSCLLVATFTTYLFNCFSFSLLSSPHPCYDFFFHLFVNCKLSLVNSLSLYFLYFARIVPPRIALLAAGNTFVILFVY